MGIFVRCIDATSKYDFSLAAKTRGSANLRLDGYFERGRFLSEQCLGCGEPWKKT